MKKELSSDEAMDLVLSMPDLVKAALEGDAALRRGERLLTHEEVFGHKQGTVRPAKDTLYFDATCTTTSLPVKVVGPGEEIMGGFIYVRQLEAIAKAARAVRYGTRTITDGWYDDHTQLRILTDDWVALDHALDALD